MRIYKLVLTVLFSLCFLSSVLIGQNASAQDTAKYVSIEMKDGSQFVGKKLAVTDTHLIIETTGAGKLNLLLSEIKTMKNLRQYNVQSGEYWHETPNATRNFFGPTGYGLRKGENYYQNWMLVYNQFSFGITDNFTLGFGFEAVSLLLGEAPGFMIAPKVSFPIYEEQWNIGVGGLLIGVPYSGSFIDAGIIYGVNTFGTRDRNFSIGLGFGTAGGEFAAQPTITLSGNLRTSRRFALITENYIIPIENGSGLLFMLGGRYIGDRLTWDFAISAVGSAGGEGGDGGVIPLPIVGVTIPFYSKSAKRGF
jgi:hypothetical protein